MLLHKIGSYKKPIRQTAYLRSFLVITALVTTVPAAPPLHLALMGDVMLGRGIAEVHHAGSWQEAFADIRPFISAADIQIANLESPIGNKGSTTITGQVDPREGYNLCAPEESIEALATARFDLLTLANNHTTDCSADGMLQTGRVLMMEGIEPVFQDKPVFKIVRGVHLAFFAFDDAGVPMDGESAAQKIRQAGEEGWLPIVSIHWGSEYHPGPDTRQRTLAQDLADAGAVLIWGHHPHVLQQAEWMQGIGNRQPVLVLFSLGNALFDQPSPPDAGRSAVVLVTLSSSGVEAFESIPIQIDFSLGRVIPAAGDNQIRVRQRLGQK